MRKGFDYLLVALVLISISSFFTKVGAVSMDPASFVFLSYSIGTVVAFAHYRPRLKGIKQAVRSDSLRWGIVIGVLNFLSFFTAVEALAIGPGSIIWPLLGLNLVAIVGLSMVIFKERLNKKGILGFVLAIIALLLLR